MRSVHFNCPKELHRRMRVWAAENDSSMTALIIEAVTAYLDGDYRRQ